jgi:hypothetical protein
MAAIKVTVAQDKNGVMKKAAQTRAEQVFEDAVIGMQMEFENHSVTKEVAQGIGASNISKTLGGKAAPKNLYSFIGFEASENDQTGPIRDALSPDDPAGPKLRYGGKEVMSNQNARFKFEISAPDKQRIYKNTPMPWASGWSWAQKIETKIPGFSRFLAEFMGDPSRSGGGVQIKGHDIRSEEYTPPDEGYLTTIFQNFLNRVRQYNRGGFRRRFK